jgi:hypothetical protein
MRLDYGMLIFKNRRKKKNLCSFEAKLNYFIDKKGENNPINRIPCSSITLPGNPQNFPQEFLLGEVWVKMKFTLS